MKLWHSFIKELKLSSKSFYFYVEIFMALLLLFVLMFVVPEEFNSKSTEYLHLDFPEATENAFIDTFPDVDGMPEVVEIKTRDGKIFADLYETEEKKIYMIEDKETMIQLAEDEKKIGAFVQLTDEGEIYYEYYLQGYESTRLKNLMLVIHNEDPQIVKAKYDNQDVRPLSTGYGELTDRENIIPSFLTFNGSLMGLFIIAAYIFLDKQEGIIRAYAVTASSVWQYLLSKVGVIIVTSVVSSFIMLIPIMGLAPNYLMLLILLITTGLFVSSLGLLVASFYKNIMQSFGVLYTLVIVMILPNIAYFIPSWNPTWIKLLPTYSMLEGFRETILPNGDMVYVLRISLAYLVVGVVLFLIANIRYKKTLTV